MHTKSQIQQILESNGIKPNKKLGQNFLIDLNLMRLFLEADNIGKEDVVLEVGCGTGSLTSELVKKAGFAVVAELDKALSWIAANELCDAENVRIFNTDILEDKHHINEDILAALREKLGTFGGQFKLVANLPYNAASPVMINLLTSEPFADEMHVTVQKEVGERMLAKEGSGEYGILGILMHALGETVKIRTLKPSCFWPQPQVDSMMLSFIRVEKKTQIIKDIDILMAVITLFMGHRRKVIKGCTKYAQGRLSSIQDWTSIFNRCGIEGTLRAEQISPDKYVELANECFVNLKNHNGH